MPVINWKYLVFSIFFCFFVFQLLFIFFLDPVDIKFYQSPSLSPNSRSAFVNHFPNFLRTVPIISIKSTYLQNSISRRTNPNYDSGKGVKTFTWIVLLNIQYFFSLILCLEQTIVSWGEFMEIKVAHVNIREFSLTFTKQINWRGKLLVNIHENFSEFYFTNTDELRSYRAGEMKDQLTRTSYIESCVTLFQCCFNDGHWRCINVVQR